MVENDPPAIVGVTAVEEKRLPAIAGHSGVLYLSKQPLLPASPEDAAVKTHANISAAASRASINERATSVRKRILICLLILLAGVPLALILAKQRSALGKT